MDLTNRPRMQTCFPLTFSLIWTGRHFWVQFLAPSGSIPGHFCALLYPNELGALLQHLLQPRGCKRMSGRMSHLNCPSVHRPFDFPLSAITLVTAVNMRDAHQGGLMPKQAAPAAINTLLGLLCALFCLYTTHLSTSAFVSGWAPARKRVIWRQERPQSPKYAVTLKCKSRHLPKGPKVHPAILQK